MNNSGKTMKTNRYIALLILVSCFFLLLTSCSQPNNTESGEPTTDISTSTAETDASKTGEETTPLEQPPQIDYAAKYKEAEMLAVSGDKLHAAQIFMEIYSYEDSLSQYQKLMLNNRISTYASSLGLLNDDGSMQVITDTGTDNLSMKSQAESWTDLVSVSSHAYGIIGLKNDGTVVATEDESPSKWYAGAAEISDWTDIQQITCGTYITVGLKSDGTVVATKYTGDIEYNKGQSNVSNWTGVVGIAAGSTHTVGLKSDGTVIAVGDNSEGQCNTEDWTDIVAISASSNNTLGLKADGTVVFTGENISSAISKWTDIVYASVGYAHVVGLKADGTVVATGSNNNGECDTANWKDMLFAAAGSSITLGVKTDGTVVFIGNESNNRASVNGYNLFTGEYTGISKEDIILPSDFPSEIPLYEKDLLLKTADTDDGLTITFSTNATEEEAFSYYEKWCADRGGYIKQPYNDNVDMLIAPMHDIEKAVVIMVAKGATLEDGSIIDKPCVIIALLGGDTYDSVANLK